MKIFLCVLVFSLSPLLSFGGEGDRYGLGDKIASKGYYSLSFEATVGATAVLSKAERYHSVSIVVNDNESATIHVWNSKGANGGNQTAKCIDLVYRHPEQKILITRSFYWCDE